MAQVPLTGPCEAILRFDSHGSSIFGVKCHDPGALRPELMKPFGVILCDNCYERIKEKGDG